MRRRNSQYPSPRSPEKPEAALNDFYKVDEAAPLNKPMEILKLADETGNYTATCKIITQSLVMTLNGM